MSLQLPKGSRCLLIGANGAGKTTLLKIIAGKHMVSRDQVVVLGASPFHDTELTTSGELAYVGGNWTRDIAFAGTSIPLTVRAYQRGAAALGDVSGAEAGCSSRNVCAQLQQDQTASTA
jgi:ABC-type cobalamin/Fe3+-siderophores transport system ATPase subunit